MTSGPAALPAAVVTGAGSGIGRAIALELGRRGHPLLLIGRRREPLQATLAESGTEGRIAVVDVRDESALSREVRGEGSDGISPTIAIPAAGVARVAPFEKLSEEELRVTLDTNLFGALNLYRAVLPAARSRGGYLFAILSAAALRG